MYNSFCRKPPFKKAIFSTEYERAPETENLGWEKCWSPEGEHPIPDQQVSALNARSEDIPPDQ